MDISPLSLVRLLLPKTPLLLYTAICSALSLTTAGSKQDLRTALVVAVVREILKSPSPMGETQRGSLRDPGVSGRMWISKVRFPAVEEGSAGSRHGSVGPREALGRAIGSLEGEYGGGGLDDGTESGVGKGWELPENIPVEAEWTGYRDGVGEKAPRLEGSEEEQYAHLMKEVKSETTILYFHGGAYIVMDLAMHRIPVANLARKSGGARGLSVRYRLSPQHPFPAALLDALTAYLALLSPPPGSLHEPVPAAKVVFSGDSAGGNLSLALLLLLLTLQREGITTIRVHGQDVKVELPGGVAVNSPWCDISSALPSCTANVAFDYLVPSAELGFGHNLPPDELWPVSPPRMDLFVGAKAIVHPLVSPVAARSELWKGAPPVYMCLGNELLEDEAAIVARRMNEAGVHVRFDGYEAMPHCFGMMFPGGRAGRECMSTWTTFIRDAAEGKLRGPGDGTGKVTWAKALSKPVQKVEIPWEEFKKELNDDVVDDLLRKRGAQYIKKEEEMLREWKEREASNTTTKSKL